MTFEEWFENELRPNGFDLTIDDLKMAYKAGFEAGYEKGDYLEAWQAGYNQGWKESTDET